MRVTVIGGGVIGLCSALSLVRRGADVTLLERDRCGSGCSLGNTGWIVPSLSAPLPAPGVMSGALKGMLRRDSPLKIRPVLGPGFLGWAWGFWKACSPERYRAGLQATLALGRASFQLFDELRASGVRFEIHATGMVVAALTREGVQEFRAMVAGAQDAGYEEPVELLDGDALRALEPALSERVVGGLHAPAERYVRPEELTKGLAEALAAAGARVLEQTEARRLLRRDGRWAAETPDGTIEADRIVVAAGAWSGRLLTHLGLHIPMEAAKGYSVTAAGPGTPPRHALYLVEARVGLSVYGESVRIAGVFDLTGLDLTLRRARIDSVVRTTLPFLRDWSPEHVELEWAGLRPYPSDGLPIIGPVPGLDGLVLATGHGRMGITLAPATGNAVSALVLDGMVGPEIRPFGVERFLG